MNQPLIANMVQDALLHLDGERYKLHAFAVMPNHVHAGVEPGQFPLHRILHSWKSFTSNQIQKMTGHVGQVWMKESYDHIIRSGAEYDRTMNYILENPLNAELKDWRWVGALRSDS